MDRSDEPGGGGSDGPAVGQRERAADDELLTPGQVAQLFGVDPKTVARWSDAGKLEALRTLGGHRRYRANDVHELLDDAERQG